MSVTVGCFGGVRVFFQMHLKLGAADPASILARDMQVETVQVQLRQFGFQHAGFKAQVQHGPQEHVAADAAEEVEVKGFHTQIHSTVEAARALIWAAA